MVSCASSQFGREIWILYSFDTPCLPISVVSIFIELDTYTFSEEGPPSPMPVCILLSETTERAVAVQATTVDGTALGKTSMKPGLVA